MLKMNKSLFVLSLLVILLICASQIYANSTSSLRFVFAGPRNPGPPNEPHFVDVFRFNESAQQLELVWASPSDRFLSGVMVFADQQTVCMQLSKLMDDNPQEILLCSEARALHFDTIRIDNSELLQVFSLRAIGDSVAELLMAPNSSDTAELAVFDIRSGDRLTSIGSVTIGELRIAGPTPVDYGMLSNVKGVALDASNVRLDDERITGPLVIRNSEDEFLEKGRWKLYDNNDSLSILITIGEGKGDTSRTVVIVNRKTGELSHYEIPGPRSDVRYFDGWLAGIVRDFHPDYDFEHRFGPRYVSRNQAYFINCYSGQQFVINVEPGSVLLWVDDTVIVYKDRDRLFVAEHTDGVISNRRLLVGGGPVYSIHWVYKVH